MAFAGPEVVVDAPPLRPAPSSLLVAADVIDHAGDDRFVIGSRWDALGSGAGAALEFRDPCANDLGTSLATGGTHAAGLARGFAVIQRDECSGFGWQQADYEARAREALVARDSFAVERQFEANPLALAVPYLRTSDASTALVVGGGAVHPRKALALPYLVDLWSPDLIMSERGGRILSPNGNVVVAGNGYTGVGPDGSGGLPATVIAGTVWAYATDLIVVDREATPTLNPPTLADALDRTVNTIRYRASRFYSIRWARRLHAAVKITVDLTTA
jgi:hypothetical protein